MSIIAMDIKEIFIYFYGYGGTVCDLGKIFACVGNLNIF